MHTGTACRCGAATSTPTRSSRPSTSSGSPAPASRTALFAAWRQDPDFVLNRPDVRRRHGPGRRPRLRHRLVARARRLGAAGLRLPGRHLAAVRRHLPRQLAARAGCSPRVVDAGRRRAALGGSSRPIPALEVTVDLRVARRSRWAERDGAVRRRRLHPLAAAGRARRHRPHAPARRRDHRVRGRPPGLVAHDIGRSRLPTDRRWTCRSRPADHKSLATQRTFRRAGVCLRSVVCVIAFAAGRASARRRTFPKEK